MPPFPDFAQRSALQQQSDNQLSSYLNMVNQQRSGLGQMQAQQQYHNAYAFLAGVYGMGAGGTTGYLGANNAQATTGFAGNNAGVPARGDDKDADAKKDQIIEHYRRRLAEETKTQRPALSLRTSPIFGFLRYRFDSPLKPIADWIVRWAWRTRRSMA